MKNTASVAHFPKHPKLSETTLHALFLLNMGHNYCVPEQSMS